MCVGFFFRRIMLKKKEEKKREEEEEETKSKVKRHGTKFFSSDRLDRFVKKNGC